MDRQEYARHNAARYIEWGANLYNTPYTGQDLLDWAVISAHYPFEKSVDAFHRTRGLNDITEFANQLTLLLQ